MMVQVKEACTHFDRNNRPSGRHIGERTINLIEDRAQKSALKYTHRVAELRIESDFSGEHPSGVNICIPYSQSLFDGGGISSLTPPRENFSAMSCMLLRTFSWTSIQTRTHTVSYLSAYSSTPRNGGKPN
jgi:hypothetical protein